MSRAVHFPSAFHAGMCQTLSESLLASIVSLGLGWLTVQYELHQVRYIIHVCPVNTQQQKNEFYLVKPQLEGDCSHTCPLHLADLQWIFQA